ncbi:hypothetical protein BV898_13148 [Hypsibius exemplaris]|uniref:Uncharacterized protein n=1 Tax=Hypsibius exemplaris TaxID=2072580 RepID=A0A1W0WBJ6_HYPEX|nr:hypothetical protein BV898_13148 [Hypsibius exemplaris]
MEKESQKSEAQSPERTDCGIYAGVEKYAKEDDPKDNVAYDPATGEQTGAGVPPTTAELSHRSKTDGRETVGYAPKSSHNEKIVNETGASIEPDEVTKRAVVPAPAPTREHLIENYPHVFPKLEQQAAADAKQKAEEEAEKNSSGSSSGSDSDDEGSPTNSTPPVTGYTAAGDATDKKHHKKQHKSHDKNHHLHHQEKDESSPDADGKIHRGPIKAIAHVLHLDRHDRKVKREEKEQETKEMRERRRNIKTRNERLEHGVNELTQTEETSRIEEDSELGKRSNEGVSEGGAVSDARAPKEAIPLEILNPEGLERKEKEDALLKSGGDFEELAWRKDEGVKIPADRVDNLIQTEKARVKAGLPAKEPEKDLKMAFHTADSFDRLDKVTQVE